MERFVVRRGQELVFITDNSTDTFVDGVFKVTRPTLFGNARRSTKAFLKAGYKLAAYGKLV